MSELCLHSSKGILRYEIVPGYGYRAVVEIDEEISNFARALIPKSIRWNRPLYAPHISVIRKETPRNLYVWGAYQGEEIPFEYDSTLFNDATYWWLRCWSRRLETIREELGLPTHTSYTRAPDGAQCFHTTVANTKGM